MGCAGGGQVNLSVLIPAHNEASYIGPCLSALLASEPFCSETTCEVLVLANGCTDATVQTAQTFQDQARARGWTLRVLDLEQGGKLNALNCGDRAATGQIRVYLDADVTVDPDLLPQLATALDTKVPCYASGHPRVSLAKSWVTRTYARFWQKLPFLNEPAPGFGVFAMNAAGRARWTQWPDIISDDTFARLQFTPSERIGVPAGYDWPMVEGFARLTRVRRRQNKGVEEIAERYPMLIPNQTPAPATTGQIAPLALGDPLGFIIYALVAVAVKTPLFASQTRWVRGR
ncbi:glycosyltransferase family 2 protein [Aliisedimentitalea scapharcae]|uniref:glycosyltransferase family 2 protein n=1 Tax=Aliisedimentitalea scapharcae TaxID=1524259 RepID=UPI003872C774